MENATKALLMAGGVLIAIIIIGVMVAMFGSTGKVTQSYDKLSSQEEITKFNSNFTKYIGKKLTIHEVVTICNFAENNKIHKVIVTSGLKSASDIPTDVEEIKNEGDDRVQKAYKIKIDSSSYDSNGFISTIEFTNDGTVKK